MSYQLGIITINYYSEDLLSKFIDSVMGQLFKDWCIVIVNSGSNINIQDFILDKNDLRLFLISAKDNPGYATANNIGFDFLKDNGLINNDSLVCFSNPDIILEDKDILAKLVSGIDKYECDFIGPKIVNEDKSLMLPHLKPTNYLKTLLHLGNNGLVDRLIGYNRKLRKIENATEVYLLNGSFFISKASSFEKAGKFNSDTFLYFEEEIFFKKAAALKMRAIYEPAVKVKHLNSATVRSMLGSTQKKKVVYESELYLIKNVLKSNSFLIALFKVERKIEYLLVKFFSIFRRK